MDVHTDRVIIFGEPDPGVTQHAGRRRTGRCGILRSAVLAARTQLVAAPFGAAIGDLQEGLAARSRPAHLLHPRAGVTEARLVARAQVTEACWRSGAAVNQLGKGPSPASYCALLRGLCLLAGEGRPFLCRGVSSRWWDVPAGGTG